MKFLIQKNEIPPTFSLIYREEEYSFNTESHSDDGITSIMVNDLQLEIDDAGKIICNFSKTHGASNLRLQLRCGLKLDAP